MKQLEVQTYLLGPDNPGDQPPATIERRRQRDGRVLWVVKSLSCVLNREGELEYEPNPSSRSDEFIARTRFDSVEEAYNAWQQATAAE